MRHQAEYIQLGINWLTAEINPNNIANISKGISELCAWDESLLDCIFSSEAVFAYFNSLNESAQETIRLLNNELNSAKKMLLIDCLLSRRQYKTAFIVKNLWVLNHKESATLAMNLNVLTSSENIEMKLNKALQVLSTTSAETLKDFLRNTMVTWSTIFESPIIFNLFAWCFKKEDDFLFTLRLDYTYYYKFNFIDNLPHLSGQVLTVAELSPAVNASALHAQKINISYWYDKDDIDAIFKASNIDGPGSNITIFASIPFEDKHALKGALGSINHTTPHTFIIPFNINGNHWISCVLKINPSKKTAKYIFIDTMNPSSTGMYESFENMLMLTLGYNKVELDQETLRLYPIWEQKDWSSCGPYMIANSIRYALDNYDENWPTINQLREIHVDLLGESFSKKQFSAHLASPTYQEPEEKRKQEEEKNQKASEIIYSVIQTFSEDSKLEFYSLCQNYDEHGNLYSETRQRLQEIVFLEKSLNAETLEPFRLALYQLLNQIFSTANEHMTIEQLEGLISDDTKGKFSDNLNKKLENVLKMKQAPKPNLAIFSQRFEETVDHHIAAAKKDAVSKNAFYNSFNPINRFAKTLFHPIFNENAEIDQFFKEGLIARHLKEYQKSLVLFNLSNSPHSKYAAGEILEFHLNNPEAAIQKYLEVYHLNKHKYTIRVAGEKSIIFFNENDDRLARANKLLENAQKLNPEALFQLAVFYQEEQQLSPQDRAILVSNEQLSARIIGCLTVAADLYHPHAAFLLVTLMPHHQDRLRLSRIAADPEMEKSKEQFPARILFTYRNYTIPFKENLELTLGEGKKRALLSQIPISENIHGLFSVTTSTTGSNLLPEKHQPNGQLGRKLGGESLSESNDLDNEIRKKRFARLGKR